MTDHLVWRKQDKTVSNDLLHLLLNNTPAY